MLDPNKEFGSAVRVARVKFNLTQVELAEKLSTTDRTVSKIETGKTNPRLDTVAHFSKELHISLDAIIHQSKETGMSIPYCVQMRSEERRVGKEC